MHRGHYRWRITFIVVALIASVTLASYVGPSWSFEDESDDRAVRSPAARATATRMMPERTATPLPGTATPARRSVTPMAQATPSARCSEAAAQAIVEAFITAYNSGNRVWLMSLFPREAYPYAPSVVQPSMNQHQFRGYVVDELGIGSLEELHVHLAKRHAASERFTLQDFHGESYQRDPRWQLPQMADFAVQLIQEARDITPRTLLGKGAVNCVDGTLNFFLLFDTGEGLVLDRSLLSGEPLDSGD